jgi:hypothetical protein
MANPPSRDALRAELERRGLPPAYVERLLGELDDHFTDLLEERSSSMGAARKLDFEADDLQSRLGEPTQLAIFAAEQYRARSFWGRHPFVTFVLGPFPLLVGMLILFVSAVWIPTYCIGTVGDWLGWMGAAAEDHLYLQAIVLACFSWGLMVLPPVGATLVLCRIHRRNALPVRWPLVGCTLLAIIVTAIHVTWRLAIGPSESERGMLMFGMVTPWTPWTNQLTLLVGSKFLAAMSICLLLVKRSQQKLQLAT